MHTPLTLAAGKLSEVLLGKNQQIRLAMACLLAGGHLLLEDLPGTGKTTLAEALARCFGLQFHRLHFTSDLLPADLTGVEVLEPGTGQFRFQPGPLFCQVLLADEINRASPRSQSALLEAMANGRVSVNSTSHSLPEPFVVIASQNGLDQSGTSPLPESQLDRFLMRLSLGFPDREAEAAMLNGQQASLNQISTGLTPQDLLQTRQAVHAQTVTPALIHYVLDLVHTSREQGPGLSPRASQGLLRAAKAWALLEGARSVTPDHVQAVFGAVAEHRLDGGHRRAVPLSQNLLERVDAFR
ncbi:MAG: MoxR family ATPase [Vulcanococcus sp.]|uniref:AAA family ATPase n=1 Tax=Vulcanococcus sp. TaxID=2856995 RepID=UPI0025DDA6C2|nr:MoxR family ATPase [Vulcanococcus sp.]MBW0167520.1 MoxR family ATPase [Vulcanococcus sp.]